VVAKENLLPKRQESNNRKKRKKGMQIATILRFNLAAPAHRNVRGRREEDVLPRKGENEQTQTTTIIATTKRERAGVVR